MSLMLPTLDRLNSLLKRPKHQSGANLVCPTTRTDKQIFVCCLVRTHHKRYCIIQLFLVWPVQLSQCKKNFLLSQAMFGKEVVQLADNRISTLATISSLISQEIDLPRKCFAMNTKKTTVPRCRKVDGPCAVDPMGSESAGHNRMIMDTNGL